MNARTARLLRVPGMFAVIIVAILSLVPVELRPHIGPKLLEHSGAYLLTAALLALAYPQRGVIVLGLSFYSAALELAQIWIPGRTASLADFAASSFGACLGVVLIWAVSRLLFRAAIGTSSAPAATAAKGRT